MELLMGLKKECQVVTWHLFSHHLQLFHHLEIVELDMSRQIARKSSAFFDTMTYLNAQMEQLKLNHAAVSTLRW